MYFSDCVNRPLLHMAIQSLHLLQLLSLICVKTRIAMRSNGPQHKYSFGKSYLITSVFPTIKYEVKLVQIQAEGCLKPKRY
jgi:hypothetical protein